MKLYVSPACATTRLRPSETVRMSASVTICKSSVSFFGAASILAINSLPINSWKACSMLWPKNFPDKVRHYIFFTMKSLPIQEKGLPLSCYSRKHIPSVRLRFLLYGEDAGNYILRNTNWLQEKQETEHLQGRGRYQLNPASEPKSTENCYFKEKTWKKLKLP